MDITTGINNNKEQRLKEKTQNRLSKIEKNNKKQII